MKALLPSGTLWGAMRLPRAHPAKFRLRNILFSAVLLISACCMHKQMACQVILGIVRGFLLQVAQKRKKITNDFVRAGCGWLVLTKRGLLL